MRGAEDDAGAAGSAPNGAPAGAPAANPVAADPLAPAAALAATVAHDLGNLLTVILGNAELLLECVPDRPDLAECATLILAAAQRGTELTERLDRLARRIPQPATPADPVAVITAFIRRMTPELPYGVSLEAELPPQAPGVLLQPATLTLVLEELVGNGLAAVNGRGRVRITLAHDAAAGRVRLSVVDDGPGIAPETLRRIREGRFTSGIAGHKTGMGLALVQRVATACGGSVSIHSASGEGTRVTLDVAAHL